MSVSIDIDHVIKRYGNNTVINGLSLSVKAGEFFTLLGPSGCGKTTLLRMVIGFNSIEGGTISIGGKVINDVSPDKRNMGMVFQNYAIFPHMSVKDNVAFGLRMRKVPEKEIEERVDHILKVVKIDHLKDRMPVALSGGQQQRVALARAIVIRPEVLLMDEPLSNLDAKLRIEMRSAIKQIQKKVDITTMYVTHDQEEALAVSDRIAVMNNGVIQQIGKPADIYKRPANVFVSTFIGLSNLLPAVLSGDRTKTISFTGSGYKTGIAGLISDAGDGEEVIVSVRPEEFEIHTDGREGIRGIVSSSIFLGLTTHYFIHLETGKDIEALETQEDHDIIADGTHVTLTVKPNLINVFRKDTEKSMIEGVVHE